MKKVFAASTALISALALAAPVYAQINVGITPPNEGINPATPIGTILSNVLIIIFVIAALAVLFMLIWGAFQWITSGGEKEAVQKARGRIIAALVGLAVLALAFLIVRVVGQLINLDILNLKNLPTLDQRCGVNQVFDPNTGGCTPARPVPSPSPAPRR